MRTDCQTCCDHRLPAPPRVPDLARDVEYVTERVRRADETGARETVRAPSSASFWKIVEFAR